MTIQKHDIVETSFATLLKELAARLLDGWAICPSNPGDVIGPWGAFYTVSLYRDHNTVAKLKERAGSVAEAPKPDRGAILAAARAAKAAKKSAEAQDTEQ